MGGEKDDDADYGDAVPSHITKTKAPTEYSVDLDDLGGEDFLSPDKVDELEDAFANADTDTMDTAPGRKDRSKMLAALKPEFVMFRLLKVASNFAPCFFCGAQACDLTFVTKSHEPGKTKAYAVHSHCVFDHEELQALGSGGL